jgi:hypothetical protein
MNHRVESDFLAGDSEMAALIRARDWSNSPLGPITDWPQSLRTTVSLALPPISRSTSFGDRTIPRYNDGYKVCCGEEHPLFLGMDYSVAWA